LGSLREPQGGGAPRVFPNKNSKLTAIREPREPFLTPRDLEKSEKIY
jgi:hypothetical protein